MKFKHDDRNFVSVERIIGVLLIWQIDRLAAVQLVKVKSSGSI